jgi:murein DD-endopeptidase MepM/ murein hydrolase activator NlpD
MIYPINPSYINSPKIKWSDVKYGKENQKQLTPCTFKVDEDPTNSEMLYNQNTLNPKIINVKLGYDYELEALGNLELSEGDITKVGKFIANSDQFNEGLTKPLTDNLINENSIGGFGEPGILGKKREGVIITTTEGTKVYSATGGKVVETGCLDWTGNYIKIEYKGFVFMYGHLKNITITQDSNVQAGTEIGEAGKTALCKPGCDPTKELCGLQSNMEPRLHFGIYEYMNGPPLDPYCAIMKTYGFSSNKCSA